MELNLKDIVYCIGADRYQNACTEAMRTAPHFSTRDAAVTDADLIAHEITDVIFANTAMNTDDKAALALSIYEEMPTYSLLSDISLSLYDQLTDVGRQAVLRRIRTILEGENASLCKPIEYMLGIDLFEYPNRVEEAWNVLLNPPPSDSLLQRVLICSGPVPFQLKERLYGQLISDKKWHYHIFQSLMGSKLEYFGDIDGARAKHILDKLDLPEEMQKLDAFRQAL